MTAEGPCFQGPFLSLQCGQYPVYSVPDLIEAFIRETVQFPHFGPLARSVDPVRDLQLDLQRVARPGLPAAVRNAKSAFTRECLGSIANISTKGNDSTFYRPPTAKRLRHYLSQIPEEFQMCFKVLHRP